MNSDARRAFPKPIATITNDSRALNSPRTQNTKRSVPRRTIERDRLVSALLNRFQSDFESNSGSIVAQVAAGTTRLGQVEFLDLIRSISAVRTRHRGDDLEEGLLIRVRQRRYSSVAVLSCIPSESKVRIHLEFENRTGATLSIPFRIKRPRQITLGKSDAEPADCRWYRDI